MLTDRDYELLSEYLDDALNAAERAALETRLNAEAELRRELEALRGTITLVKTLTPRTAPRNFTLDARMIQRPAPRRRTFFSPAFASAISAAAAVLLIGFGLLTLTTGQNAAPLTSAVQQVGQQGGEQDSIALAASQTPLQKGSDDGIVTGTTAEEAVPPGQPSDAGGTLDNSDILNQASGGGGASTPTRDEQSQQASPSEAQVNAAPLPQATFVDTVPVAPLVAPSVTSATADGFSAFAAPQTEISQEYNTQGNDAASVAQSDQAVLAAPTQLAPAQRTMDTPTLAATATITLTPSLTLTSTATATSTPSDTPVPPTPLPTVTRDAEQVSTTDITPLLSLGVGVVLLLVSLFFYLRSRRNR